MAMQFDVDALMRQLKEHAPVEMAQVPNARDFLEKKMSEPSRAPSAPQR
jgi:hypothetical protein